MMPSRLPTHRHFGGQCDCQEEEDERPFKCEVCGRAFRRLGKLHRHRRIHTGERPYECAVCHKTFIQSGQLVIHRRSHTGERPYVCRVCGKGFPSSKQLKVHTRTHTGDKPYTCQICGKSFGYRHVLKYHQVSHSREKGYPCTSCEEPTTKRSSGVKIVPAAAIKLTEKRSTERQLSLARSQSAPPQPLLEKEAKQFGNNSSTSSNGETTTSTMTVPCLMVPLSFPMQVVQMPETVIPGYAAPHINGFPNYCYNPEPIYLGYSSQHQAQVPNYYASHVPPHLSNDCLETSVSQTTPIQQNIIVEQRTRENCDSQDSTINVVITTSHKNSSGGAAKRSKLILQKYEMEIQRERSSADQSGTSESAKQRISSVIQFAKKSS